MSDNTIINEAKKWIDGLSDGTGAHGSWRLETIGKRYRYQSGDDGKRHRIPVRIRRFAKGIPWSLVFEALKYLESQAPYSGFLFNGVRVDAKYRPTSTAWRRDDQENIDGNAQGSYTLVQDLVEDGFDDVLGIATSSSCSEEVVTQWHWDSAQVEELPVGGQGCTYAIQSVRRNEDGTLDYALVRRTALTRYTPEHVQSSNEYETVYVQSWDNAYGTPDKFTDHEGNVLDIPSGKSIRFTHRPGLVSRRVVRNDDCTFRVDVERKVPYEVESSEVTSQQTAFAADRTEESTAQVEGLSAAPVPVNGTVTTHKTKKRPDGLYDNTVSTRKELPVDNVVTEYRSTPRARIKTVTHKSRTTAAPINNVPMGDSVRNEMTDGGLWNVTTTTQEPRSGNHLRYEEEKTIFSRKTADTKTTTSVSIPAGTSSGNGHVRSTTYVATDAGGYEVTYAETDELHVASAVVDRQKSAKGVVVRTTDRNQSSASSSVSAGTPRVVVEKTDGGSRNVTTTTLTPRSGSDRVMVESDAFSSTREETAISVSGSVAKVTAESSSGKVIRKMSEVDDIGFTTTTTRIVTEKSVPSAVVETQVKNRATVKKVTSRNQTSPVKTPTSPGTTVSSEMTPGSQYNTQTVTVSPRIGTVERMVDRADAFKTVREVTSVASSVHSGPATVVNGVVTAITSTVDEDGVVTQTKQVTTERIQSISRTTHTGKNIKETTEVYLESAHEVRDLDKDPPEYSSVTLTRELTEGGLYRVTRKVSTVTPYNWSLPVVDTGYSYARTIYFRNYLEGDATGLINDLTNDYTQNLSKWISQGRGPANNGIDISVDFDMDHGVLNGVVKLSASWLPEQPGINGALDKVFVQFKYTTTSLISSYIDKAKGFYCYYLHKHWRHVEGRGIKEFSKYLDANRYDASFTFNPRTTVWSIDLCTGIVVNQHETFQGYA